MVWPGMVSPHGQAGRHVEVPPGGVASAATPRKTVPGNRQESKTARPVRPVPYQRVSQPYVFEISDGVLSDGRRQRGNCGLVNALLTSLL